MIKRLGILSIVFLLACVEKPVKVTTTKPKEKEIKPFALKAFTFCKNKKLNLEFCFIIDLSKHSGYKRFYVYDFLKDTITDKFMVSHGCGNNPWKYDSSKDCPCISNAVNSHCSSVGKYIVEKRGRSEFGIGIKYNLIGVDSANKNAYKRAIVLHGWEEVTDNEKYPQGTAEGWGCPAVSNETMCKLDKMLKKTKSKTLLWIIS